MILIKIDFVVHRNVGYKHVHNYTLKVVGSLLFLKKNKKWNCKVCVSLQKNVNVIIVRNR